MKVWFLDGEEEEIESESENESESEAEDEAAAAVQAGNLPFQCTIIWKMKYI